MAYITTEHSVGATVYAYNPAADCVLRLIIVGIQAVSRDRGYSPSFAVSYQVRQANDPDATTSLMDEDLLHSNASGAFPKLDETAAAQAPTTDA